MQFEGVPEGVMTKTISVLIYRVTEIADDKVVLDGNHPLAGMALVFTCTVTAVRPATRRGNQSRAYARRQLRGRRMTILRGTQGAASRYYAKRS
jgi:FKBP-type peptidyl-prolyl cis-trans isomerase 2